MRFATRGVRGETRRALGRDGFHHGLLGLALLLALGSGCSKHVRVEATIAPAPIACRGELPAGTRLRIEGPARCEVAMANGDRGLLASCARWRERASEVFSEHGFVVDEGAAVVVEIETIHVRTDDEGWQRAPMRLWASNPDGERVERARLGRLEQAALLRETRARLDLESGWGEAPRVLRVAAHIKVWAPDQAVPIAELEHDSRLVWGHARFTRLLLFLGTNESWRPVAPHARRGVEPHHHDREHEPTFDVRVAEVAYSALLADTLARSCGSERR